MANNRMVLVCKKCGQGIMVAKYYSSWFVYPDIGRVLGEFFARHSHELEGSMRGANHYKLEYEIIDNSTLFRDWEWDPVPNEKILKHLRKEEEKTWI